MDERPESTERLEAELQQAKIRIASLETRLASVEKLIQPLRPVPPPTAPPPDRNPRPKPPPILFSLEDGNPPPAPPRTAAPLPSTPQPKPKRDLEMEFGTKVLPWAGALVVVVALGFLTAMGIERGLFTPPMQFAGALLLSFAFLVVGYIKRGERQDFGLLLMGIGSCGVYLSLAGGHVAHKLYSGEVLIGTFMAWSFVNLGYGAKTGSRTFVSMGFIGGLIASLFTTQRDDYALQCILHFAATLASFAVVVKRGWHVLLWPGWFLGACALAYGGQAERTWWIVGLGFAAHGLLVVWADLLTPNGPKWGLALSPCALALVSPYIFNRELTLTSCGFVFGVGLVAVALAWIWRKHPHAISAGCAGAALCLLIAPIGLDAVPQCLTQVAVAVACALFSRKGPKEVVVAFGWAAFVLALAPYGDFVANRLGTREQELSMLASLAVSTVILCFAGAKALAKPEPFFMGGAMLLWPLLARMAYLGIPLPAELSFTILSVGIALGLVLLGDKRWQGPPGLGLCVLVAASFGALNVTPPVHYQLLAVGLTALATGPIYARLVQVVGEVSRTDLTYVAAGATSILIVRFLYLVADFSLPEMSAVAVAFGLNGIGFVVGSMVSKREEPGLFGLLMLTCGMAAALVDEAGASLRLGIQGMFAVALVLTWFAAERFKKSKTGAQSMIYLLGWAGISLVGLTLLEGYLRFPNEWAVSTAWGVYAGLLLLVGALSDNGSLRMAGLSVFGVTLVKVLGYDLLLKVDPLLRIAVLLALGLALLGGGYYYIRRRRVDGGEAEGPTETEEGR